MARKKEGEVRSVATENVNKLIDFINTKYKKKIATTLEDAETANVKNFVSTGTIVLDILSVNKPIGGFPEGRVSTILGLEQTGKSLLAAHACADTLRRDGTVIYIDKEHAVDRGFFKRIGVDDTRLIYIDDIDTIEQVFELVEMVSIQHRNDNPDDLFTIVWDSVAATPTAAELDGTYDDQQFASAAKGISKSLRKINKVIDEKKVTFIAVNQLKIKIPRTGERSFGDNLIAYGGKALNYHSSLIFKLKSIGKIEDKFGNIMGAKTEATVLKSKFGPSLRKCNLNIYYSHGIDDSDAWLDLLKHYEVIKVRGGYFNCPELMGENNFQTSEWNEELKKPEFREKVRGVLKRILVIDYNKVNIGELVVSNVDPESTLEINAIKDIQEEDM